MEDVPPMCSKHHSVPSGTPPPQYCPTSYQAEHHHHKIALLGTKQNNLTARLHYSVPLGAILPRAPLSRPLQSQPCLAATPLRTKQNNHHPNIRHLLTKGPHQRCRPFSITKSNQSLFFTLVCCSVAALQLKKSYLMG